MRFTRSARDRDELGLTDCHEAVTHHLDGIDFPSVVDKVWG